MALPLGGIADKLGNKYEYNYVVLSILNILTENVEYLEYEPIDEDAIDIIQCINNIVSHQQCKIRNDSDEYWTISALSEKVLPQWKTIFETTKDDKVALVSPIPFTKLQDISTRANSYRSNPQDFLFEIKKLSKESLKVLTRFCEKIIGFYNPDKSIEIIVDYLCRLEFINYADNILEKTISQIISLLFVDNKNEVFALLYKWVSSGKIFRKRICFNDVNDFITKYNLTLRDLTNNPGNIIAINKANTVFKNDFEPFESNNTIVRGISKEIYNIISRGDSCVITGDAGVGKSGCMINIIEMCEENHLPYVGIKLDKYVPINNTDEWGKSLGMICSPISCLDAISKNSNSVIFLDQLDTLRWLQIENYNWMVVLENLLDEVEFLNSRRTNKISVVFSTRSYDLAYDRTIKKIIKKIEFKTKEVTPLSEKELKQILGSVYYNLTEQEKDLLSIPSNLFIWRQLDDEYRKTITSTKKLIDNWIEQIINKTKTTTNGNNIRITINKIVDLCIMNKENKVLKRILFDKSKEIDFLLHEKFLKEDYSKESISFYHQTIYDALLVDKKLDFYDENKDIYLVIGDKKKQTPKNRYIVKMFLEVKMLENIDECLNIFNQILYTKKIRFSYKHLVIELLSRYKKQNDSVNVFIVNKIKDKIWGKYFIDEVVLGNIIYIEHLIDINLLDNWFENDKELVINILRSIDRELSVKCISFIKKYLFVNKEQDKKLYKILPFTVQEDNEETYELRLMILDRHPQFSLESYLEMNKLFKTHFKRAIDMLSIIMIHKAKKLNLKDIENMLDYDETIEDDVFANEYKYVLTKLLPCLPIEEIYPSYDWRGYESNNFTLERLVIKCIKKANFYLIKNDQNSFFDIYSSYMYGKNLLFKEIILDALFWLDYKNSSKILNYLSTDFNKYAFDITSECDNKLDLACKVIQKHTLLCDEKTYFAFEEKVIKYKEEKLIEYYKHRLDYRYKVKSYDAWCWNIWGDFQFKILNCINENRLSKYAKDLLCSLKRSLLNNNYYNKSRCHGGFVSSPVSNKKINVSQWEDIITNIKIFDGQRRSVEVPGGFIESSPEMFASDFSNAVAEEPISFIEMMLKSNKSINDLYVGSFYLGISKSKYLNDISEELLENLFTKFGGTSERSIRYFLEIIKNKNTCLWTENTYIVINDIFKKYSSNIEDNKKYDKSIDLYGLVINSVFGTVCKTISHILSIDNSKIAYFEEGINEYKQTNSIIKRFSLLFIMFHFYEKYANYILDYCLNDVYCIVVDGIMQRILQLCSKYNKEKIVKIIKLGLSSNDEHIQYIACWLLYNLYLKGKISFKYVINAKKECPKVMMRYLLHYVKKCKNKNMIIKIIVNTLVKNNKELEHYFYDIIDDKILDYKKDKKFILKLIKCDNNTFLIHFIKSLENGNDLFEYHKLIFEVAHTLIVMNQDHYKLYGADDELFTCIITLYNLSIEYNKKIMTKCLDILDLMYKFKIGSARRLYLEMTK